MPRALQVVAGYAPVRVSSQMGERAPDRRTQLMAQLEGTEHGALARLLDYRVSQLESKVALLDGKVSINGATTARIDGKLDTLIALAEPKLDHKPWQNPKWILSITAAILAWTLAALVLGAEAATAFVTRLTGG